MSEESLKKKRKELTRAERQVVRTGDFSRIIPLKNEINVLMGKEERMWRQRARICYIKEGGRNTTSSIVVPLKGSGGIVSQVSGIKPVRCVLIRIRLQQLLWSFINIYSLPPTQK